MSQSLYLEDLAPGQKFASPSLSLDRAAIISYAAQFDPQPFHLDEQAATDSLFGGLAASGWHTASLTMRLLVDSEFRPAGGLIGAGIESLRWPQPVRPDDILSLAIEVLETRAMRSRPDRGMVKIRVDTHNQRAELVQSFVANMVVQCRP
ncbi:MAG: MaoC family dehydratase [Thauera sp.]|jgi:acyl dehydratase|nr:MaoC family dehydratase [Thauera sp.]